MNDPRLHRYVRATDGDQIRYICGCVNEISEPFGVLHSVEKCEAHRGERKEAGELGREYYESLGTIKDGMPRCSDYMSQITEALGLFPQRKRNNSPSALEIGCGISMYAPELFQCGHAYLGIDASAWACEFTATAFCATTIQTTLEDFTVPLEVELILAAHVLEHLDDAPAAIEKCSQLLQPDGQLWLIVPDDSDPLNPDHLWFFNEDTLRSCIEAAGLVVEKLAIRKYIDRENFIYCRARKPA